MSRINEYNVHKAPDIQLWRSPSRRTRPPNVMKMAARKGVGAIIVQQILSRKAAEVGCNLNEAPMHGDGEHALYHERVAGVDMPTGPKSSEPSEDFSRTPEHDGGQ